MAYEVVLFHYGTWSMDLLVWQIHINRSNHNIIMLTILCATDPWRFKVQFQLHCRASGAGLKCSNVCIYSSHTQLKHLVTPSSCLQCAILCVSMCREVVSLCCKVKSISLNVLISHS